MRRPYLDHLNYIEDVDSQKKTTKIPKPLSSLVFKHCGKAWEYQSVHEWRDKSGFCPKCGKKIFGTITKIDHGQGGKSE